MSIIPEDSKMRENDEYKFYYSGKWHKSESNKTIEIKNPFNDELIGKVQACTKEEVDKIIKSAKDNIPCWEETPLRKRAEILQKTAKIIEEWATPLGTLLSKENGKPLDSAISEIKRTAEIFVQTAEEGIQMARGETITGDVAKGYSKQKISLTYRVPLGVILCIGPFNYPFNLTGSKIAPALMAGNSVVMKSSTEGSITASYFGLILEKAGLPPGVFNFVTGRGSEIGDYVVSHKDINMIAFTGSTETGKRIAKITGMKPLLMELGGKDAAIILEDADLDTTIDSIMKGAFSYSGQRCTAVKRILPMPKIANHVVNLLKLKTENLSIGDPLENKTIGPLINSKQCDYVQELIDDALEKGATLVCGNKREGNIIWPTILDNVTEDMRVAWEEPFGPVLPVIRVKTIREAIKISNESQYGLQGMIFTENLDLAFNIAQELEVGTVQINSQSSRGPDHFPFMGAKSSGIGTQGIKYAIDSMSRPKSIVLNLSERGRLLKACEDKS